jgi:glycosyltransferase involved in cell wall biosynthesis
MKIVIDARLYGLENSGIGRYLIHLIKELSEIDERNDYVLLLTKKYYQNLDLDSKWKKISADFGHYSLDEQIKLRKLIKSIKYDVIHFPHFNIPLFFKDNFVVTLHDLTMQKYGREASKLNIFKYTLKRVPFKLIYSQAVNNSKAIITPTNSVKDELINTYPNAKNKTKVIYEGYNTEYKHSQMDKDLLKKYNLDNGYLIYTGNIYPHKNLIMPIKALKIINEDRKKKMLFVIAGSRSVFKENLEELIKSEGLEDYVRLLGFVPDNELASLYRMSQAFIFPSKSEGFGLPGVEALASGTVLLASDIDVFREVYADRAIYFNPGSTEDLVSKIMEVLLMNNIKRKEMISKGKIFVKKYSWKKMAKDTLKIYERAV